MAVAVGTVWIGERSVVRLRAARPAGAQAGGDPVGRINIDYRVAAFGGLLPDLIDKPLWWWVMPDRMTDSHAWAHTFLFSLGIITVGIFLSVARLHWGIPILVLGVGSLTHPLVDPVNVHPETLFWPLFGNQFPSSYTPLGPFQEALEQMVVVGLLILATSPLYRRRFRQFVTSGRTDA
jgi:hypothetical protein